MADIKIDTKLLDDKLTKLEKMRTWSPRTISRIEAYIRDKDDRALFRINPITFAKDNHIDETEAIELFLYATKVSLFHMEWQLLCPLCSCVVKSFGSLRNLDNHYHCTLCQTDYQAALDDYIEISFTISPHIRELRFHHPETLKPDDYFYNFCFCPEGVTPKGSLYMNDVAAITKNLLEIEPKQKVQYELDAKEGHTLLILNLNSDASYMAPISGAAKTEVQHVSLKFFFEKIEPKEGTLQPGKVMIDIESHAEQKARVGIFSLSPDFKRVPLNYEPFLSGKRLFNIQIFLDMFFSETIQATSGIGVKDITILFTDLKGSTALYERIGDLKAFALVRMHFASLAKVINRHGGVIVKTIGDAVMATFPNPEEGVKAAVEILAEVEELNKTLEEKAIVLKMGLHKGHCVAVTLNERIDYFGHTVNLAARVQNIADAEEICMTSAVYKAPGVESVLKDMKKSSEEVTVKGIAEKIEVLKFSKK